MPLLEIGHRHPLAIDMAAHLRESPISFVLGVLACLLVVLADSDY